MDTATEFRIAADIILLVHVSFVLFVVAGLIFILMGKFCRWDWVRNFWFRIVHLAAIGVVVVQSWFGSICPLTTLEMSLRSRAGGATYPGAFIAHWFEALLYYQLPLWVFALCYTVFGALVLASWFWVRPRHFSGGEKVNKN